MHGTRRFWAIAGLATVLAGYGAVIARPLLLVGAGTVGAWLLTRQYVFLARLAGTLASLEVEQTVSRRRIATDEAVTVSLQIACESPAGVDLRVTASPPSTAVPADPEPGTGGAVADTAVPAVALERGGTGGRDAGRFRWPVAGGYAFEAPTVRARDAAGLFEETLGYDPAASDTSASQPDVTVEARYPRNVHVGTGGERFGGRFGDHDSDQQGAGLDPAEIRKYVPGETVDRIDWKATARLDEPHVRVFEADTDRRTLLVVDHRAAMAAGPRGETKLDFAREVALGLTGASRDANDPLGLVTVGDGGLTDERLPGATGGQYAAIRSRLLELAPTGADRTPTRQRGRTYGPAQARRAARTLAGDDSAFATTLGPYFENARTYVTRVEDDPLFRAVSHPRQAVRGTVRTVLVTDDTDRAAVREAVTYARGDDGHVVVFLTPTVLFEAGGLADVEDAYARYADFESFRQELAAMPRVSAFEVGPGDRLDAVLTAGRGSPRRGSDGDPPAPPRRTDGAGRASARRDPPSAPRDGGDPA